jgi:flagellar hook assembly protein FlgD
VFHTSNRNGSEWTDWDGKNSRGTDLPEGTYYYLLTLKSKSGGQVFRKSGFVVLKRY